MEKLAKATGGQIVGTLKDLSKTNLGQAKIVEEVKIGEASSSTSEKQRIRKQ